MDLMALLPDAATRSPTRLIEIGDSAGGIMGRPVELTNIGVSHQVHGDNEKRKGQTRSNDCHRIRRQ